VIDTSNAIKVEVKECDNNIEVTVNLKPSFIVNKKIVITESKVVEYLKSQGYNISSAVQKPDIDVNNYSGSENLTAIWVYQLKKTRRRYTRKKNTKKQE